MQQQAHAAGVQLQPRRTRTLHVKGHTRTAALAAVWGVIHREKGEPLKMPSKALYKSTCKVQAPSRNWVLITTWGRPWSTVEGDSNRHCQAVDAQWQRAPQHTPPHAAITHHHRNRRTQPPHTTASRIQQPQQYASTDIHHNHNATTPIPAITLDTTVTTQIHRHTHGTPMCPHLVGCLQSKGDLVKPQYLAEGLVPHHTL